MYVSVLLHLVFLWGLITLCSSLPGFSFLFPLVSLSLSLVWHLFVSFFVVFLLFLSFSLSLSLSPLFGIFLFVLFCFSSLSFSLSLIYTNLSFCLYLSIFLFIFYFVACCVLLRSICLQIDKPTRLIDHSHVTVPIFFFFFL